MGVPQETRQKRPALRISVLRIAFRAQFGYNRRMNTSLECRWLGCVEYASGWELQNQLAAQIAAGQRGPVLLLLEHPHTYTLGRQGHAEHLLWDADQLRQQGAAVHWVDRGGDITYHGPGQLVAYPLLRLAPPGWVGERLPQADFTGYLRRLEAVIIHLLAEYGVEGQARPGLTGVWVRLGDGEWGKIASIGVKVDARGVTRHGLALNLAPEMRYWQGIVPCGLAGVRMTALAELMAAPPDTRSAAQALARVFARVFDLPTVWAESEAEK